MKFALIDEKRQEAHPNLSGQCPACGQAMVAKCGEIKVWHWAHQGHRTCDPWWENETEWHRLWKNHFPKDWQEVVHYAENGERHISDIKTHDGWFLEFQHSHIEQEERHAREEFYQSLIWIVDGTRRSRDATQFSRALADGKPLSPNPGSLKRKISSQGCALLRDWARSRAHVFFDFGEQHPLWWLFPGSDDMQAYVQPLLRTQLIKIHLERHRHDPSKFDSLVSSFKVFVPHSGPLPPSPWKPKEAPPLSILRPLVQRRFRF